MKFIKSQEQRIERIKKDHRSLSRKSQKTPSKSKLSLEEQYSKMLEAVGSFVVMKKIAKEHEVPDMVSVCGLEDSVLDDVPDYPDRESAILFAFALGGMLGVRRSREMLKLERAISSQTVSDLECVEALKRESGNVTRAGEHLDMSYKSFSHRINVIAKRYSVTRDIVKGTADR